MPRKRRKATLVTSTELMKKVRKPIAPPTKIEEDLRKYDRARERRRLRRGQRLNNLHQGTPVPNER
jgi:hypothetical protein